MKTVAIADLKSHLSSILREVENGIEIAITNGKKKETIAVLVPIEEYRKSKVRKLGSLKGKMTVKFSKDFKMSDKELLGL
jgi:prevent-host-death family protein